MWFSCTDVPFFKCFRSKRNTSLQVVCYNASQSVLLDPAYSSIVMAYARRQPLHLHRRQISRHQSGPGKQFANDSPFSGLFTGQGQNQSHFLKVFMGRQEDTLAERRIIMRNLVDPFACRIVTWMVRDLEVSPQTRLTNEIAVIDTFRSSCLVHAKSFP